MSDAAQGEPIQHEVFRTPFKVEPKFEMWPTPSNYREYSLGEKLPDKLKVWRVQNSGKDYGSVVSSGEAFDGFPDAELLTVGYNVGKPNGSVGVGRHGNFLQWGFSGPPSQMTDAGKAFFLNCICYIRQFDGKAPLVQRRSTSRTAAPAMASISKIIKDPKWITRMFPENVLSKHQGNPEELASYYRQNLEWVYQDKLFYVDEELKGLGIESNRTLKALGELVAMLGDSQKSAPAAKCLHRYTNESFTTTKQWEEWLQANQGRIFFSDTGGYKFIVVPSGY